MSDAFTDKARIIQESVPGKQITLAHIIANPDELLTQKLKIKDKQAGAALGILTVTPGETALIAGDLAIKASGATLAVLDISSGTVVIHGSVSQVEASLASIIEYASGRLGFEVCAITKS